MLPDSAWPLALIQDVYPIMTAPFGLRQAIASAASQLPGNATAMVGESEQKITAVNNIKASADESESSYFTALPAHESKLFEPDNMRV